MFTFELRKIFSILFSSGMLTASLGFVLAACTTPCRPNAPRIQVNPCVGRNPCALRNPCAAKHTWASQQPCKANPCAIVKVNPAKITRPSNYRPYQGNQSDLLEYGEKLYKDARLSTNGLSCNTCHQGGGMLEPTFAQPYPHFVAMARERSGLSQIHLDEMIQLCLVASMASEPIIWNSRMMAAMTTYTAKVQQNLRANPCAAKNPCAIKNPCAMR